MSASAQRLNRLPLDARFLAGFGLVLAILLTAGAVQYRTIQTLVETERWVAHTDVVLAELEGTLSAVESMESDSWGYVATGDLAFVKQRQAWGSTAKEHLRRLRVLTADDPRQQGNLDRLNLLVEQKLALMPQLIALRRQRGTVPAAELIAQAHGTLMKEIHTLVAAMEADENRLLAARQAASRASAGGAVRATALGSLLALVFAVVAGWIIHRDATARAEAKDALRHGAYNRSLIEASLDPLVTISPDGKITDVNEATAKVTGVARDKLIGTDFSSYFTEAEQARAGYLEVFKKGFITDYPLTLRHVCGPLTHVLYSASLYRNTLGNVLGVFAAARDVTERKRAEDEVAELNAGLERRVADRTAELLAANQELEAFTYSVAHDLRAPLRHAQGFSRSVLEDFGGHLPQAGKDCLHDIVKSTQHMGQLIDDMLGLARIGRQEPRLEVTGLGTIVQEVLQDLKADLKDREMSWQIGALPFVSCDPGLMKQVFFNLIANAVKYTRPRHPAVIEVGQIAHEGQPAIFVKDNGVGFSMKYSGKLFGVFQRLHRREDFEGTGVGLATVQRIVRKHGGRIWAEAELDKGAAFYFTLATPQPGQSQAQPTIPAKPEQR